MTENPTVFVLTFEQSHEPNRIEGVYRTLAAAMNHLEAQRFEWHEKAAGSVTYWTTSDDDGFEWYDIVPVQLT